MHFLTVLIIHNHIILGASSGNVSRFLEDGVGATFINNCHVNATRGEGSNKMWSVLANQGHRMLRCNERYTNRYSRISNICHKNVSTPTSEFYECKHPFNPAHKPAHVVIFILQHYSNTTFLKYKTLEMFIS